jgi:hypothetical protein
MTTKRKPHPYDPAIRFFRRRAKVFEQAAKTPGKSTIHLLIAAKTWCEAERAADLLVFAQRHKRHKRHIALARRA